MFLGHHLSKEQEEVKKTINFSNAIVVFWLGGWGFVGLVRFFFLEFMFCVFFFY